MHGTELLLIPLGFAVGAYGTFVGAGGGFILVPALLVLYLNKSADEVTAISLMVVFFNAASGSAAYARLRRIDYSAGLAFALAALPGSVVGALLVTIVPRRLFDVLFGLLLLVLAAYTWWSIRHALTVRPVRTGRGVITRIMAGEHEGSSYRYSYNLWQGILFSIGVGFMSSLLGIGGGIIHVPIMIALLHFPVHIAVATSHFVLAIAAASATATHIANGSLHGHDVTRALLLGAGVVPGAQVGARLSQRFQGTTIVYTLVVALALLSLRLLYEGLR